MSRPDERTTPPDDRAAAEFAMLLEAHAGRSLTLDEDARLRTLATGDAERRAELAAFDELHGAFDAERRLFERVAAPWTAAEEADEGVARLARAAAGAEDALRAQLRFAGAQAMAPVAPRRGLRRASLVVAALAAAAVCVVAILLARGGSGPGLLTGTPDDAVLGAGSRIVMQSELRADRPLLSWHPVVGASRYDARIEDDRGELVLARPDTDAASTLWELSREQFAALHAHPGKTGLRLRIVARDGAKLVIGSSGDLPLRLVD